jgi:hypothetical protein
MVTLAGTQGAEFAQNGVRMYRNNRDQTQIARILVHSGEGTKKRAFVFVSVLVLAWTIFIGWDRWVNAHRIVAGPENQSQFFTGYNPKPVVAKFQYDEGFHGGDGNGASQGINSILHSKNFEPGFTMQADRKQELLNALREDILFRLRTTGMTVVASHDEEDGGFTYKYISGNSIGSISVLAPVHDSGVHRQYQLRAGLDDISFRINMEETWTRPASEHQWWMAMAD